MELYNLLKLSNTFYKFASLIKLLKPNELNEEQNKELTKLLIEASNHQEFKDTPYVLGEDNDKRRLIILNEENVVVGFLTPRFDSGYYRTGAIYTNPKYRGFGYASKAIIEFYKDHRPGRVWIADYNTDSKRAFARAGFDMNNPLRKDLSSDEIDKGCYYFLH